MNVWIKFIKAAKGHAIGEVVQIDEASAKVLIENEFAEKTEAPADIKNATTEIKSALLDFVKTQVEDAFSSLKVELKSAAKRVPSEIIVGGSDFTVPSTVKRYGSLKNIKGVINGRSADQRAYEFGMWMLGMYGNENAQTFCTEKGLKFVPEERVQGKVSRENNNISSGFLVPDQFENDLIDLRETFGVFRKYAKIVPMASDTRSDPRRTGGLTAYFVGESTSPTASDKTWDRVRLTAKKVGCLTKYTRELNEDAVINIGDDLAGEIAYAFAAIEDDCGFNGDGTSTYGGMTGVRTALDAANTSTKQGCPAGAGSTWASLTLANHNEVLSRLPQYAFDGDVAWYCSQAYWGSVMQRLATAAGGNTVANIVDGVPTPSFLGYPVRIAQKLPTSTASGAIPVLFGNLRKAARFGDRRSTSIRMSDVALNSFEQDEIAIVGFERFDIVAHDVGTDTVAGPIVGLKTT